MPTAGDTAGDAAGEPVASGALHFGPFRHGRCLHMRQLISPGSRGCRGSSTAAIAEAASSSSSRRASAVGAASSVTSGGVTLSCLAAAKALVPHCRWVSSALGSSNSLDGELASPVWVRQTAFNDAKLALEQRSDSVHHLCWSIPGGHSTPYGIAGSGSSTAGGTVRGMPSGRYACKRDG